MPIGTDDRCVDPSQGPSVTPLYYQVPYISQIGSDGWEDDWNQYSNCGPTSMAMIARAFDYRNDLRDARQRRERHTNRPRRFFLGRVLR